ncbi:MAG: NTP transferase domain-containing protein, partial [Mycobacteriales bacterium]
MHDGDSAARGWVVVMPVKELTVAKTRLTGAPGDRAELALAMAADVASAAVACPLVTAVVVVTNDPRAADRLRALGAVVVADADDHGLNAALREGAARARDLHPDAGVATLAADLPAATPAALA